MGLTLGPSGSVFVIFRKPVAKAIAATRLLHDGELVLSTKLGSQPQVRIERATYGVPGSPDRTRDVRAEGAAKGGCGRTQLPGVIPGRRRMTLLPRSSRRWWWIMSLADAITRSKGQDPATVHLTADAVKVQVEKARYGVLDDPKRTRDVRDKLQRLLDAGETSFPVARMAEGDDPAVMVVKTLEVEYTHRWQTACPPTAPTRK